MQMSIGTALFACFVVGFVMFSITMLIRDGQRRKWLAEDKQKEKAKKSQELFKVRMTRLRRLYGDELGSIKKWK